MQHAVPANAMALWAVRREVDIMRSTSITSLVVRCVVPVAAALWAGMPCAAEARGGGTISAGMGGFHGGGAFQGGAVFRGATFAAPGAPGRVFGGPQRTHLIHHGARLSRSGVLQSHTGFLAPPLRPAVRLNVIGFVPLASVTAPPLTVVTVPPLATTTFPPLADKVLPPRISAPMPLPAAPSLGGVEIWRLNGSVWRRQTTLPPVAAWRRDADGRWLAEPAN